MNDVDTSARVLRAFAETYRLVGLKSLPPIETATVRRTGYVWTVTSQHAHGVWYVLGKRLQRQSFEIMPPRQPSGTD